MDYEYGDNMPKAFLNVFAHICILQVSGTPSRKDLPSIDSMPLYDSVFPRWEKRDLGEIFRLDPDGVDLMEKLLTWDPSFRIDASKALGHKWFQDMGQ